MFRLEKEFRFEAAHVLPCHDGKCARLHGHSWVGRIVVEGTHLHQSGPKAGMLVDYNDMKAKLADMVDRYLDHHHLNETLKPFGVENPTSEVIARWVYNWLKPSLPELVEVIIEETCTSRCCFRPHQLPPETDPPADREARGIDQGARSHP